MSISDQTVVDRSALKFGKDLANVSADFRIACEKAIEQIEDPQLRSQAKCYIAQGTTAVDDALNKTHKGMQKLLEKTDF